MPLIKSGNNGEKRIAPPPPGVATKPTPAKVVSQPKKSNGGNVRGQVAMHVYNSKVMSPEYAGRFVTHQEFLNAVRKDTLNALQWFESEGLL